MTSVKAGYPYTPLLEGDPLPFSTSCNITSNNGTSPMSFSTSPNSLQNNGAVTRAVTRAVTIPFSLPKTHVERFPLNKFIPRSTEDRFTSLQKFLFRRLMSSLSLKPNRPQQPGIYRSPTGDLDESVLREPLTDRRHGIVGGALTFSPAS